MKKAEETVWMEHCDECGKKHRVSMQPCPDCGVHYTPQPVSGKIHGKHSSIDYICDGCDAYQDHLW